MLTSGLMDLIRVNNWGLNGSPPRETDLRFLNASFISSKSRYWNNLEGVPAIASTFVRLISFARASTSFASTSLANTYVKPCVNGTRTSQTEISNVTV